MVITIIILIDLLSGIMGKVWILDLWLVSFSFFGSLLEIWVGLRIFVWGMEDL